MAISSPVSAFNLADIANNLLYSEIKASNYDFDILVLDFVIPNNSSNPDILRSLTVNNTRDADNSDIDKVILWTDNGDDIWQGYMIDAEIASAERIDSRHWVFDGLNAEIPVGGLHLYISVETKTAVTTGRKIQFEIEQLSDVNGNGEYDYGDRGIFEDSANDGPFDQSLVSGYLYSLEQRTIDILAPKAVITNLNSGDKFKHGSDLIIQGSAKDRMQGSPKLVRISVAPSGSPVWQDVNILANNFAEWDYKVVNLAVGDYDVQTYVSDWDGNSKISDPIKISIIASEIVSEIVSEPKAEIVPEKEVVAQEQKKEKLMSEMTVPELQAKIAELLGLLNQIKAMMAELYGTTGSTGTAGAAGGSSFGCTISSFTCNLILGMSGNDVKCLQIILNSSADTKVAVSGLGSSGNETSFFGAGTRAAVIKFQNKYASEILAPYGLTVGNGFVGSSTRTKLNSLLNK